MIWRKVLGVEGELHRRQTWQSCDERLLYSRAGCAGATGAAACWKVEAAGWFNSPFLFFNRLQNLDIFNVSVCCVHKSNCIRALVVLGWCEADANSF